MYLRSCYCCSSSLNHFEFGIGEKVWVIKNQYIIGIYVLFALFRLGIPIIAAPSEFKGFYKVIKVFITGTDSLDH